MGVYSAVSGKILPKLEASLVRSNIPEFRPGDTVRVHVKIIEGTKERVQIFQGLVIKRHKTTHPTATFTVRKVSYNIGVERTFLLNSPRIEKIEVVGRGAVRRARLFYLRPLRGKQSRIKTTYESGMDGGSVSAETEQAPAATVEASA